MNIILCLLFLIIIILYLMYKIKKESFQTTNLNKLENDIYIMKGQILSIDYKFENIINKLEKIETTIYGTPVIPV
jgi:hypothetical protein